MIAHPVQASHEKQSITSWKLSVQNKLINYTVGADVLTPALFH